MARINENDAREINDKFMRIADQALENVAGWISDAGLADWCPISDADEGEVREAITETAMHTWDIGALLAATIEGGYLNEHEENALFDILARATKTMLEENEEYNHI